MKFARFLFVALLISFFLTGCATKTEQADPDRSFRISVVHFNDLHGYLKPHKTKQKTKGGIARIATFLDRVRAENDAQNIPTLVLFAGDMLQGSLTSMLFHGEAEVTALNSIGITAATVGNHEFDYGQDNFAKLRKMSDFPWLTCNVRPVGQIAPITEPYKIFTLSNGLRVGVIGVTTPELLISTSAKNVKGLAVDDPIKRIGKIIEQVDAQTDMIVVLSHSGIEVDEPIADNFGPEIDLIVGGHNHNLYEQPVMHNGVPITQAGCRGEYLGRADMIVEGDVGVVTNYKMSPITEDIPEEPKTAQAIAGYLEKAEEKTEQVIGQTAQDLPADNEVVRRKESKLANFITDTVRESFEVDAVLQNGGGIRATLFKGPIKLADMLRTLPFSNTLVRVKLKGREIRKALNEGLKADPMSNPGSFMQVSGIRYKIESRTAADITIGGKPLDDYEIYEIIINSYLSTSDEFPMFQKAENKIDTGVTARDIVIEAIKTMGTIDPKLDGRIERLAPWTPEESSIFDKFLLSQGVQPDAFGVSLY